jgi:hypothetical protein
VESTSSSYPHSLHWYVPADTSLPAGTGTSISPPVSVVFAVDADADRPMVPMRRPPPGLAAAPQAGMKVAARRTDLVRLVVPSGAKILHT